jgi:hypothetical protein
MKKLGLHRVDGRSFWFGGYFNAFDRERLIRYAGQTRADRFHETYGGRIPFATARIVKVFDSDPVAAQQFADTFHVAVARDLDDFAEGLDGAIVPFPSGGPARDYGVTAPLAERGIPLFLDRIILEQSEALAVLCRRCAERRVPLHVTCFMRYFAELLLPPDASRAEGVEASTPGEPAGYGADLLDLVDELMQGEAVGVTNTGTAAEDVLRIRYADGRQAILRLIRDNKPPAQVTAYGDGWRRALILDGSQNHLGAYRQFEAFVRSLTTREPPVPYECLRANAAILHAAERREFGREFPISSQ